MRGQVAFASRTQNLRLYGDLYRLRSPFECNLTAWICVAPDKSEAIFTLVRAMSVPNLVPPIIKLNGLDPKKRYLIEQTGEIFGGDELMRSGLCCPLKQGDAASVMLTLKAVDAV